MNTLFIIPLLLTRLLSSLKIENFCSDTESLEFSEEKEKIVKFFDATVTCIIGVPPLPTTTSLEGAGFRLTCFDDDFQCVTYTAPATALTIGCIINVTFRGCSPTDAGLLEVCTSSNLAVTIQLDKRIVEKLIDTVEGFLSVRKKTRNDSLKRLARRVVSDDVRKCIIVRTCEDSESEVCEDVSCSDVEEYQPCETERSVSDIVEKEIIRERMQKRSVRTVKRCMSEREVTRFCGRCIKRTDDDVGDTSSEDSCSDNGKRKRGKKSRRRKGSGKNKCYIIDLDVPCERERPCEKIRLMNGACDTWIDGSCDGGYTSGGANGYGKDGYGVTGSCGGSFGSGYCSGSRHGSGYGSGGSGYGSGYGSRHGSGYGSGGSRYGSGNSGNIGKGSRYGSGNGVSFAPEGRSTDWFSTGKETTSDDRCHRRKGRSHLRPYDRRLFKRCLKNLFRTGLLCRMGFDNYDRNIGKIEGKLDSAINFATRQNDLNFLRHCLSALCFKNIDRNYPEFKGIKLFDSNVYGNKIYDLGKGQYYNERAPESYRKMIRDLGIAPDVLMRILPEDDALRYEALLDLENLDKLDGLGEVDVEKSGEESEETSSSSSSSSDAAAKKRIVKKQPKKWSTTTIALVGVSVVSVVSVIGAAGYYFLM